MIGLLFNRFTLYAAVVAVAAAGFYTYRSSLIQQGYDQAMAQVQEAESERLRELLKENTRLVGVVEKLHAQADKQKQDIAAFRARQRADAERLRSAKADFDKRLAAASAESLRRFAEVIDSDLGRCAEDIERFAVEAAECSIAAHTLNDYLKERP